MADYAVNVDPADLARVCANGAAFMPARVKVKAARLSFRGLAASLTASDGYTVGRDTLGLLEGSESLTVPRHTGFSRDALEELAAAARRDKGVGRLEIVSSEPVARYMGNNTDPVVVSTEEIDSDFWAAVDETMVRLTHRPWSQPEVICFDPALMARFSKVRVDKAGRHMDMWFGHGATDPVLVKIGPTFVGAIMPVDREVNAKNIGPEGLWND